MSAIGLIATIGLGLVAVSQGCRRAGVDEVAALEAHLTSSRDPRIYEIRAQVALPSENLRYKWFADGGECEPHESTEPTTIFHFAPGETKDLVTVEVWRNERRLGRATLEVREGASIGQLAATNIQVEITKIPPAAPGGPNTQAEIAGRVIGKVPRDYKVLVYARDAGVWFIQPTANARHPIAADGTWSTWTHTGWSYAVLVVSPNYRELRTLDMLPLVRGEMVARTVIEGASAPATAP